MVARNVKRVRASIVARDQFRKGSLARKSRQAKAELLEERGDRLDPRDVQAERGVEVPLLTDVSAHVDDAEADGAGALEAW